MEEHEEKLDNLDYFDDYGTKLQNLGLKRTPGRTIGKILEKTLNPEVLATYTCKGKSYAQVKKKSFVDTKFVLVMKGE